MMARLSADIFVKHLVSLNFINSCLFSSFSVNTIEDKLEGAVKNTHTKKTPENHKKTTKNGTVWRKT